MAQTTCGCMYTLRGGVWPDGTRSKMPHELDRADQRYRHRITACMVEVGLCPPRWEWGTVGGLRVLRASPPACVRRSTSGDLLHRWINAFKRANLMARSVEGPEVTILLPTLLEIRPRHVTP